MDCEKYISLALAAQETGLPKILLRRFVDNGTIPAIKSSRRILCKMSEVTQALDKVASGTSEGGDDGS